VNPVRGQTLDGVFHICCSTFNLSLDVKQMRTRFAQLADSFQTDPAKVCGLIDLMPRS